MDIVGKIYKINQAIVGESKNGTWKKRSFILEVPSEFSKKICFIIWNDKVQIENFKENDNVKVYFNIESREYKDNWYTDLQCWKIEYDNNNQNQNSIDKQAVNELNNDVSMFFDTTEDSLDDDLPF